MNFQNRPTGSISFVYISYAFNSNKVPHHFAKIFSLFRNIYPVLALLSYLQVKAIIRPKYSHTWKLSISWIKRTFFSNFPYSFSFRNFQYSFLARFLERCARVLLSTWALRSNGLALKLLYVSLLFACIFYLKNSRWKTRVVFWNCLLFG